jgi:hypothetical protein
MHLLLYQGSGSKGYFKLRRYGVDGLREGQVSARRELEADGTAGRNGYLEFTIRIRDRCSARLSDCNRNACNRLALRISDDPVQYLAFVLAETSLKEYQQE